MSQDSLEGSSALSASPEHLRVLSFGQDGFVDSWNSFLASYSTYTFRYMLSVIDYYKLLIGPQALDCSFVLMNTLEDVPVCICPLIINANRASYEPLGSKHLPAPLFSKLLSKKQNLLAQRYCNEVLDRLFNINEVRRWYSEQTVGDVELIEMEETLPANMGALDVSIQNHFLRVDVPEDEIRLQIRTRVRKEINQGLRNYEFKIYDKSNFSLEIGDRHRLLHHKTAGRITRPIETFHRSYQWVLDGEGLMFEQLYQGKTVNMTLIGFGGKSAYGMSTADDPDFVAPSPMMHAMLWVIALELKRRGFTYYETGATNHRDTIHEILTPKEKNIVYFKKSFGDITYPFKKWIWFSSKQEEILYLEESLNKFKTHFSQV